MTGVGSLSNLSRYAAALVGNAGSSGAQFAMSLVLVARLPADGFGSFMFLMLLSQFAWAIAGALFAAPMATLSRDVEQAEGQRTSGAQDAWAVLVPLQLAFLFPLGICAFASASFVADGWQMPIAYALVGVLGCLRQFGRISQYSWGDQRSVVRSDALFCVAMTIGLGVLLISDSPSVLLVAFSTLALAQAVSLMPLLRQFMCRGVPRRGRWCPSKLVASYRSIWSRHSGWSLLGVVSTEATASAHNYLVTAILGPGALGAIAASGVLTRPGNVALLALGEFERARLAKLHAQGGDLAGTRRLFMTATGVIWLVSLVVTCIALAWFPDLLSKKGYDPADLAISAWGWLAVLLVRCAYLPMSTELQSLGAFRELAWPTVIAMPVSILGSLLLIALSLPAWTLVAIALGQVVVFGLVWQSYAMLLKKGAQA